MQSRPQSGAGPLLPVEVISSYSWDANCNAGRDGVLVVESRARIEECRGFDARTLEHLLTALDRCRVLRLAEDLALRKLKHRGLLKVAWIFTFAAAVYNLLRMRKLIPIPVAA